MRILWTERNKKMGLDPIVEGNMSRIIGEGNKEQDGGDDWDD